MESLMNLYDLLCDQVDEVVKKGDISPSEMDHVYKATKTMYYIECIEAMENADGYDGVSGNWPYANSVPMRREHGRTSYAKRSSRTSMRNYSGHDQKEMMLQKIAEMQRQIEDMAD